MSRDSCEAVSTLSSPVLRPCDSRACDSNAAVLLRNDVRGASVVRAGITHSSSKHLEKSSTPQTGPLQRANMMLRTV
jgi:hypothetical protein